nr:ABC transporter ATP-binding protein [Pelagibacterium montanilacus]
MELDGVDRVFGQDGSAVHALNDINLDVDAGDFVALVGPSGCGKSTILRILAGLEVPDSGAATVAGREVGSPAAKVGLAFQNPTMLPWLTVEANVMLPLKIVRPYRDRYQRERKRSFRDRAMGLLESVGLGQFASKYPWQLSGGMVQRANLCRALIHEPDILLLDEPFGALDQFTRESLWITMQSMWIERRPTVLLVTHDLREAAFLASRIIVMTPRPGRILEDIAVPLQRPRTIEGTYDTQSVDLCRHMRALIDSREGAI